MSLRRFWRREDGSTAVEFGFLAAPFLALIVGGSQLFVVSLAQQMLETAAEASGRLVLTGNAQKQGLKPDEFKQSVCASLPAILSCGNVMVDVQVASSFSDANTSLPTVTYDKDGNIANKWQYQTGNPGDVVVMRIMYRWPLVNALNFNLANLPANSRLLFATTVFKNEAYK